MIHTSGFTEENLTLVIMLAGFGMFAGNILGGHLSDRVDRRYDRRHRIRPVNSWLLHRNGISGNHTQTLRILRDLPIRFTALLTLLFTRKMALCDFHQLFKGMTASLTPVDIYRHGCVP
jgi:MFS family permease